MKKIISLFQRNYDGDHLVRDEIVSGAEWVVKGEGVATQKFDGTCCMIKSGCIYKRYDNKHGKNPPEGFQPAQDPDPITGHWPGWIKCSISEKSDKWFFEALSNQPHLSDGTYELCGPKVQSNPEALDRHTLIFHGETIIDAPRSFNDLKEWFKDKNIEGIVWHHPDGRMVKIKKKDFGLKRVETLGDIKCFMDRRFDESVEENQRLREALEGMVESFDILMASYPQDSLLISRGSVYATFCACNTIKKAKAALEEK